MITLSYLFYCLILGYFLVLIPRYLRYRNRLYLVLIILSGLGSIYEIGTGVLWLSKETIRLDIFFIVIFIGLAYLLSCLFYFAASGLNKSGQAPIIRLHALYLIPPLVIIVVMCLNFQLDTRHSSRKIAASMKNFREACHKSNATLRRCFGELDVKPDAPVSGHFRNLDSNALYNELLINQAGKYWLISSSDYLNDGELVQQTANEYQLKNASSNLGEAQLIQIDHDQLQLKQRYSGYMISSQFQRVLNDTMRSAPTTNLGQIKFDGVYSALERSESAQNFWLTQVWIWYDDKKIWGYLLRRNFNYGSKSEFLSVDEWQQNCHGDCISIQIKLSTSNGQFTMQKNKSGSWQLKAAYEPRSWPLLPGQFIPVLMLDQAPLTNREHNQQWLRDLNGLYHSFWQIPASEQLQRF